MKTKDIFFYALGGVIAVGTVLLIILLLIYMPDMRDVINMAVGAYIAAFSTVVAYFFGSSRGSAEKNEMLKNDRHP
jgi:uncharacterized membrane protein YgaE (UPF0421/DUF939 family)